MLGIAFLGQALAGLFGGLLAWMGQTLIKRIAVVVAFTAIVAALVTALFAVLDQALGSMYEAQVVPDELMAGLAILPSNTAELMTLIITVESALWLYRMSYKLAAARVGAT